MKHVFYKIGFAVSKLHQKYNQQTEPSKHSLIAETYTHGDLHSANIFYDSATENVTLIDNETFALSLTHPASGVNDIVEFYMLHTIKTLAHNVSNQLTNNHDFGIDDQVWHELWRTLFDGYFAAFGALTKSEFETYFRDFRNEFLYQFSHASIFSSFKNLKDQRKLKRLGLSSRRSDIEHNVLPRLFEQTYAKLVKKYEVPAASGAARNN